MKTTFRKLKESLVIYFSITNGRVIANLWPPALSFMGYVVVVVTIMWRSTFISKYSIKIPIYIVVKA